MYSLCCFQKLCSWRASHSDVHSCIVSCNRIAERTTAIAVGIMLPYHPNDRVALWWVALLFQRSCVDATTSRGRRRGHANSTRYWTVQTEVASIGFSIPKFFRFKARLAVPITTAEVSSITKSTQICAHRSIQCRWLKGRIAQTASSWTTNGCEYVPTRQYAVYTCEIPCMSALVLVSAVFYLTLVGWLWNRYATQN